MSDFALVCVKGSGFDSQCGGFSIIHIGDRKMCAQDVARACNSFDDLVAALRDMTRIATAASGRLSGNAPRIAKARAALAKAGAA